MAMAKVNGVQLFYEINGTGEVPLVFVHGSWDFHHDWDPIVPRLADSFRVVTYDRRGHSESERPTGPGSVHEDVDDRPRWIDPAPGACAGVGDWKFFWRLNHASAGGRASGTPTRPHRTRAAAVLAAC